MYSRRHRAPRRHPPAPLAGCACSPPWRGARSLPGCAATGAAGCSSWRATRPRRSTRATTTPASARSRLRPASVVAPSSPLGHRVAAARPRTLLDDFHSGVLELGAPFELWASLVLPTPAPARVDTLLDAGAVGLSLPAGALGGPAGIESLGPALERLARAAQPLFVHPGPARRLAGLVSGADRLRGRDVAPPGTRGRSGGGRRTRRCASSSRCSPGSRRCTPSGSPPAAGRARPCTTA